MLKLHNNFDATFKLVGGKEDITFSDINELKTLLPDDEILDVCYNCVSYAHYSTNELKCVKFELTHEMLCRFMIPKTEHVIEPIKQHVLVNYLDEGTTVNL